MSVVGERTVEAAVFVPNMPTVEYFDAGEATMVRLTYTSGSAAFERVIPFSIWVAYIERESARLAEFQIDRYLEAAA